MNAEQFGPDQRWDVERFWSTEELVALGRSEAPVSRGAFIEEAQQSLTEIAGALAEARAELMEVADGPTVEITLSDAGRFTVGSGVRLTRSVVRTHPGELPVFSCFHAEHEHKGSIDEAWLAVELAARREKRR